jgi:hypothetical protein
MDKFKLANITFVYFSTLDVGVRVSPCSMYTTTKWSNLKLKNWSKKPLNYLPLALALPGDCECNFFHKKEQNASFYLNKHLNYIFQSDFEMFELRQIFCLIT